VRVCTRLACGFRPAGQQLAWLRGGLQWRAEVDFPTEVSMLWGHVASCRLTRPRRSRIARSSPDLRHRLCRTRDLVILDLCSGHQRVCTKERLARSKTKKSIDRVSNSVPPSKKRMQLYNPLTIVPSSGPLSLWPSHSFWGLNLIKKCPPVPTIAWTRIISVRWIHSLFIDEAVTATRSRR
jgi:hypothetical protein